MPTIGILAAPPGVESLSGLRAAFQSPAVDGLWWPDHWMGWGPSSAWEDVLSLSDVWPSPDLYADPFIEMALYGREIDARQLGTCATDAIRRHPVDVLRSIETVLRVVPDTRVVLGIGAGEGENTRPYGLPGPRVRRLEEFLRIVEGLRRDGEMSFEGEYFVLDRAPCPAPESRERMTVWVGAHGPRMLSLTAQQADGWIPMGFPPGAIAKKLPQLLRTRQDAGRSDGLVSAACVVVAVVESADEGRRLLESPALRRLALFSGGRVFEAAGARHPLGDDFNPLLDYIPGWLSPDEVRRASAAVTPAVIENVVTIGDRQQIAQLLAAYGAVGVDHIVLWDVAHLVDPSSRASSLELLADAAERAFLSVSTGSSPHPGDGPGSPSPRPNPDSSSAPRGSDDG